MASPLARGLFRRAICESSGPLAVREVLPTLAQAEQAGVRLAESMNTPADGALGQLRALPAGELLQAVRKLGGTFGAINADGWVFSEPPAEVFAAGRELPVPLIIGSNAVEFPAAGAPADWQKMIVTTFRDLAPRAQVLNVMPPLLTSRRKRSESNVTLSFMSGITSGINWPKT